MLTLNINQLETLIQQKESDSLEFKTSTAKLKAAFETLCGFLNGKGGAVLIGVKDDGTIVGQVVTDQTSLEISNLISKLEPATPIDMEYIDLEDGKCVIKLTAPEERPNIPYVFNGKPYWRISSSTKIMPQQQYRQLLQSQIQQQQPWDSDIANDVSISQLDSKRILATLKDCIQRGRLEAKFSTNDPTEALQILGLLKNKQSTNAAGVLFCKDAERIFPRSLVSLAKFKSDTKSEILDSKRIYGNAFELLEEIEVFLMRYMAVSSEFVPGDMARHDYPDYPLRAVREAVVNAICHRDYSMQGGSISFMMYADRLEIASHGTLPRGITLGDLNQVHESIPRNPKITSVMYKCGIIEAVGTGTQEIISECQAIGSPAPEFIERGTAFVVRLYKNKRETSKENLLPRQKEILDIMLFLKECSSSQILEKLSSARTDRTLRNDLSMLEEQGFICRRGEGRSTRWYLK